MIAFSLYCDVAEIDRFLRTVLYACAAGNALVTENYSFACISDIACRTHLCAGTAHDTVIIGFKCLALAAGDLRPCSMLSLIEESL